MTRYLSGLCVAGLGLCAGGWLIVAALAFGADGGGAGRVNLATGAALAGVSVISALAWAVAWRRRLRTDGVLCAILPPVSRREARRNRRQLARDVRDAAKLAKRAAREARRRPAAGQRPAGCEADGHTPGGYLAGPHGAGAYRAGEPALSWNGASRPQAAGPGGNGSGAGGYSGAGYDGASAADVLGELRTLLGPLLTAAGLGPVPGQHPALHPQPPALPQPTPQPPAQSHPWSAQSWWAPPWSAQPWPPPPQRQPDQADQADQADEADQAAGDPAGDDEVARLADSEEAWW